MKISSRKVDGRTYIFPKKLRDLFNGPLYEELDLDLLKGLGLEVDLAPVFHTP